MPDLCRYGLWCKTVSRPIEKLQQHKGVVTGVPSGFDDLDKLTSGFQASDLVIIAARPSMGKTAFVLNIAQYLGVQSDRSIGVFSLEMSKEAAVHRGCSPPKRRSIRRNSAAPF